MIAQPAALDCTGKEAKFIFGSGVFQIFSLQILTLIVTMPTSNSGLTHPKQVGVDSLFPIAYWMQRIYEQAVGNWVCISCASCLL